MKRHNEPGPIIAASEITPRHLFEQRRALIRAAATGALIWLRSLDHWALIFLYASFPRKRESRGF